MNGSPPERVMDYKQLVEAIGDAIIVCDGKGFIRFWSPSAERLFGYSSGEAVGKTLDIIIPERLRERHWVGYDKTMATGVTRYAHDVLQVPATHKDGHVVSIAFTVGLLRGPQDKVEGIVAVIRDDTARFTEVKELRKQLADLTSKLSLHGSA